MKKLVLAALAIAAMAACTKSNVQYEQPGEITLQPVVQKATKATTSVEQTYPDTEMFKVWAWWISDATGTTTYPTSNNGYTKYIDKGTFANKGTSWGGYDPDQKKEQPYYWPTTGSLFFAGYSPASVNCTTMAYSLETQTLTIDPYEQLTDISKTVDLMWFDVTDQSYDKDDATINGVPVVFKHALSWLTFKFNLKDNETESLWTITKVELQTIKVAGKFTAKRQQEPVWDLYDKTGTMTVFNASHVLEYQQTGTVLESTTGASEQSGNVVVIPQPCSQKTVSLKVTFDYKTQAGTILKNQTVILPLSTRNVINEGEDNEKDLEDDLWLHGKHYIYTIIFGADEILIAPKVESWKNVTESIQK